MYVKKRIALQRLKKIIGDDKTVFQGTDKQGVRGIQARQLRQLIIDATCTFNPYVTICQYPALRHCLSPIPREIFQVDITLLYTSFMELTNEWLVYNKDSVFSLALFEVYANRVALFRPCPNQLSTCIVRGYNKAIHNHLYPFDGTLPESLLAHI